MQQKKISIVIPTYNSEEDLATCLASIRKQDYKSENIEVLICDGGSTDRTLNIAHKFNCTIYHNKKRLAEYGVSLGFNKSKGDFVMILAADNELLSYDFIKKMLTPFEDDNIMLSFPNQVTSEHDSWIASYINTFTDPINHFIYENAANTKTFEKTYPIKKRNKDYIVYQFSSVDYPMIAMAQGTTVRRSFIREKESVGDDLLPIISLIENGSDLAYVPKALLIHHTMKTLSEFIRKQRWAIDNYFLQKSYGLGKRTVYFSKKRKIRKFIWPFYAASFVFPLLVSLRGFIFKNEKDWAYHFLLTYIVFWLMLLEIFRIKILGVKKEIARKK